MEEEQRPKVDLYYNGTFVPKPLVYFTPRVLSLDVDVNGVSYAEFIKFMEELIEMDCKHVYYCVADQSLCEGLHALQNDCDYSEFLEKANETNSGMKVYIDHEDQPIFDYIQMEEDTEPVDVNDDEDEDYVLPAVDKDDIEEDEEGIPTQTTLNDEFLTTLCPMDDDDEGEGNVQPPVYPRHDENQEWNKMEPELGMQFSSPVELKLCLSNYAVAHGYDLYYEKNDKDRILAKCCKGKTPQCPFRLYASWMKEEQTFQVKSLKSEHRCSRAFKLGSIVTYKWIGTHFVSEIMKKPKMSLRKMKARVSEKFNINVSIGQCRNAKKFALNEIEGNLKDHYGKLWDYAAEIRRANPGSHVTFYGEPQHESSQILFEMFYVSFRGVVYGWLAGCRKVVGIDGCFLKGICKGELLAAVGRDGNNQVYPIAWAVVSVENKRTWKWFLEQLMQDIDQGGTGNGITIISDGHKGLWEAVKEVCPDVEHRLCARHILANFHNKYKGECYIKPFWKAVNATTTEAFEAAMQEIKTFDVRAYNYLIERDPKCWSKAFFKVGMDCDAMENGISESFNASIEPARRLPVITMLEEIRVWVIKRMYTNKEKGFGWDLAICPAIRRKLEDMKVWQRSWCSIACGYKQFEVSKNCERYAVDLEKRECACRGWQLTGMPCVHGMAAISTLNLNPEEYVAKAFTIESYLKTYEYSIHPLNGSSMWPKNPQLSQILPPKKRRLPGRPCVNRKRDRAENELSGNRCTVSRRGVSQRCSNCHELGHKKLHCPKNPTASTSTPSSTAPPSGTPSPRPVPTQASSTPTPDPAAATTQPAATTQTAARTPTPSPSAATTQTAARNQPEASSAPTQTASRTPSQTAARTQPEASSAPVRQVRVKKEPGVRQRKASERLTKLKIRKMVSQDGQGLTADLPFDIY